MASISDSHRPYQSNSQTEESSSLSVMWFVVIAWGIAVIALLLAGWMPIGFSIATVFLFAGLHNWYEGRYFLSRFSPKWGQLKTYYLTGICGVLCLGCGFATISWWGRLAGWQSSTWSIVVSCWNSLLILWIATLAWMRCQEKASRDKFQSDSAQADSGQSDSSWIWANAFSLIAIVWLFPFAWEIGLVYLHPLIALCFLQREIKKHRPEWLLSYHCLLATLPLMLCLLWWQLAGTPNLPGEDALSVRITQHAGAGFFSNISTHLLVSTHTFLEMLHYAVWILAIPTLSFGLMPWKSTSIPLVKKSTFWKRSVQLAIITGGCVVLALWAGFLIDYPITRDVYFTIAILHVLAEFPFLIRSL